MDQASDCYTLEEALENAALLDVRKGRAARQIQRRRYIRVLAACYSCHSFIETSFQRTRLLGDVYLRSQAVVCVSLRVYLRLRHLVLAQLRQRHVVHRLGLQSLRLARHLHQPNHVLRQAVEFLPQDLVVLIRVNQLLVEELYFPHQLLLVQLDFLLHPGQLVQQLRQLDALFQILLSLLLHLFPVALNFPADFGFARFFAQLLELPLDFEHFLLVELQQLVLALDEDALQSLRSLIYFG